ncbi:hypothetical protein ACIQPR_05905 [Streptomyces sp. NPDC091280]|uniref:hypothetical protein n=1 Tax=Streptomyces sp. NPDC091280 TaxID=3365984 RepID=UPI00380529FC
MDELAATGAQAAADAGAVADVPQEPDSEAKVPSRRGREGYDERPSQWHVGLEGRSLCGTYRQIFETVVAADGLVDVATIADTLGLGREKLAVERVRHRAYVLQAKGWLQRERACSGRLRARPAIGPVPALAGDPAGEGDQAGPPDRLLVMVRAAFVVTVETLGP